MEFNNLTLLMIFPVSLCNTTLWYLCVRCMASGAMEPTGRFYPGVTSKSTALMKTTFLSVGSPHLILCMGAEAVIQTPRENENDAQAVLIDSKKMEHVWSKPHKENEGTAVPGLSGQICVPSVHALPRSTCSQLLLQAQQKASQEIVPCRWQRNEWSLWHEMDPDKHKLWEWVSICGDFLFVEAVLHTGERHIAAQPWNDTWLHSYTLG